MTVEEYLDVESRAEFPSEFIDGVIVDRDASTIDHSCIVVNTALQLGNLLDGKVFFGLKVWIPAVRAAYHPDLFVICGKPRCMGDRNDIVENPTVIIEVLSESTRGYDHDEKFRRYRQIPELKQYVLISQSEPFIEVFTRAEQGFWILREYTGLDAELELDSIGASLPLRSLYRGVEAVTE